MSTLALTYQTVTHKIKSTPFPNMNWKALCWAGAAAAVALLVVYAWQVNILTSGTYVIKGYNKQIESLTQENRALHNTFAESNFLGDAMARSRVLNFEKITEVTYVKILDHSLAKK